MRPEAAVCPTVAGSSLPRKKLAPESLPATLPQAPPRPARQAFRAPSTASGALQINYAPSGLIRPMAMGVGGIRCRPPTAETVSSTGNGKVVRRERLGGLLGFYHREAA
jgi:hypothetical protein